MRRRIPSHSAWADEFAGAHEPPENAAAAGSGLEVPVDGWLLAYHPKLVDASGGAVPGTVLHHVAFWNENRADFLCPNKEEHISARAAR